MDEAPVPSQQSITQPATPVNEIQTPPVSPKKKKLIFLFFTILLVCLFVLFTHIPYYANTNNICKPGQTDCPTKGWHLGSSVWSALSARFFMNRSSAVIKATPTKIPLPTLTPDPTANWKTFVSQDHS